MSRISVVGSNPSFSYTGRPWALACSARRAYPSARAHAMAAFVMRFASPFPRCAGSTYTESR